MRSTLRSFALGSFVPAALVAAAFHHRAWPVGRGWFPAPLDDVFIHFDFARSLAEGHPFEWIPGNGYSSGETAPLYAAALALGHLVGFREARLGWFAAAIGVISTAVLVEATRTLVARTVGAARSGAAGRWLVALAPLAVLSVGLLDWSLVSGMEVALHAALVGRALVALDDACADVGTSGTTRERAQWRLGILLALLVLVRPESIVLAPIFAVAAARAVGARSAILALARACGPAVLVTGGAAALNLVMTGDAAAAGAQLKLLSSNPFLTNEARATAWAENVGGFVWRTAGEIAPVRALAWALPLTLTFAVVRGRTRALATTALAGAAAWALLVSANGNAPFHNLRYYAPAIVLLLVGVSLGVAALSSWIRSRARWIAVALLGLVTVPALGRVSSQIDYFVRCARNIRDQQIEVGRVIERGLPRDARVLLGDAGAIPYVSHRDAIDALGLGGYRRLPFARAAAHGEVAVVELLERLPTSARPTHLALYPNWFAFITSRFGREIARVTIEDNVICGGPTKIVYEARLETLAPPDETPPAGRVDEVDVADVVDERAHGYASPAPFGGFTVGDVRVDERGAARFDGGRIVPEGRRESFRMGASARGPVTVSVRTEHPPRRARVLHGDEAVDLEFSVSHAGAWVVGRATLASVTKGDLVVIEAVEGELHDFHVFVDDVVRPTGG